MKSFARKVWGFIAPNTEWLVLLAVAIVAAWFYADGRAVRADRAEILQASQLICAGAGADFAASTTIETDIRGRKVTVDHARGAVCRRHVANLASFKADTVQATADTLAGAMKDRDAKMGTDAARAATDAAAARAATERMEIEDAKAQSQNRVDRGWYAAVNGVAGLRPND
ncbi:hypothetical protein NDN01_10010 [Sphingomonas sp. QA11]|uniref:hypothetical protein n=1 Tax=Sphingomonas sp. QA11 TaxID=2950605 RepID=UPI00234B29F2|nr:hypothetical protein [Sphingomonas sp. QA11]WCM29188.1 hypothetical protein NDN01_10010 [Sphingomonas sp. QA11]